MKNTTSSNGILCESEYVFKLLLYLLIAIEQFRAKSNRFWLYIIQIQILCFKIKQCRRIIDKLTHNFLFCTTLSLKIESFLIEIRQF